MVATVRYLLLIVAIAFLAIVSAGPSGPVEAVSAIPPVGAAGAEIVVLQGDSDCSTVVDFRDVIHMLKVHSGASAGVSCISEAGNVDCAGGTTILDALWILRFLAGVPLTTPAHCSAINSEVVTPPLSEALIAEALTAGDITYEESLLYRALALFDSPGLPDEYRSPVPYLEAATQLFTEIELRKDELSQGTLDALAPFIARPADPISIFNTVQPAGAGAAAAPAWVSEPAAGGKARVWVKAGGDADAYAAKVTEVWDKLPGLIRYPIPDTPGDAAINPDGAIDFYFTNVGTLDPRYALCAANPPDIRCNVAGVDGYARVVAPFSGHTSSGYLMLDTGRGGDWLSGVIAHELFHVSQFSYDFNDDRWLQEATATWGEFRVLQKLGKTKDSVHQYVKKFMQELDQNLTRDAEKDLNRYGSWQYFFFASMRKGDGIVGQIWQTAAAAGDQGPDAVDAVFPFAGYFDQFTVRNWNHDYLPIRYQDMDATFPDDKPISNDIQITSVPADEELSPQLNELSARYYTFTFSDAVRTVEFENKLFGQDGGHVWAIAKIGGAWKDPEDWSDLPEKKFCRDVPEEDVSELVIILSNTRMDKKLDPPENPVMHAKGIGCPGWHGTMTGTQTWDMLGGHGTASSTFTGTWVAADPETPKTYCQSVPDACIFYTPDGTISWSWDAHREEDDQRPPCDQTTSGSQPAEYSDFFSAQGFFLQPMNEELQYKFYGNGYFQVDPVEPLKCNTAISGPFWNFFEIDERSDPSNPPGGNGSTCWGTAWRIAPDAETIDGSCYGWNFNRPAFAPHSLHFSWHLTRVGKAIP